jgi:hypothetical protein
VVRLGVVRIVSPLFSRPVFSALFFIVFLGVHGMGISKTGQNPPEMDPFFEIFSKKCTYVPSFWVFGSLFLGSDFVLFLGLGFVLFLDLAFWIFGSLFLGFDFVLFLS